MSTNEGNDGFQDWNSAIGGYISGFAYVELLVYKLYDLLPRDRLTTHGRKFRDYSDRVRFLQALLRSTVWSRASEIEKLLEDSLALATLRNQIAHNPMFIDVWMKEENDEITLVPDFVDARKGHSLTNITGAELEQKMSELASLSERLAELVHKVMNDQAN